ncbi:MAG: winged helix-turn-helix domain-containing protein [Actinobacteria bacterium]|nr:winged helix-turn-helix domain-containing protein [Actinomycetota bacterium]
MSEAGRQEMLPSGRQATFDNRVAWAKAHMKVAGLLSSPKSKQLVGIELSSV